jgi:ketosteroid isomerase-like protein
MKPFDTKSSLALHRYRQATSSDTDVRTRTLAWCSAWSSVNGAFQADNLRRIVADGPVRMAADFGHDMAVILNFDSYATFWAPLLSRVFSEWSLVITGPMHVQTNSNLASARFETCLRGQTHDGERKEQRQDMLLMWENNRGMWRLVQEQISVDPQTACL